MVTRRTSGKKQTVTVAGRKLALSNLDKVLYPETGTTKADVLHYYAEVAPLLINAAKDRPATRKRWVHGVGTADAPGEMFFQKNLEDSAPDWIARATLFHKDHANVYPLVNDPATLAWLGQIAALEIHVPQWRFSSEGQQQNPDRLVLDLDPGPGAGLPECVQVANWAREILAHMGLDPVPVTSGSKGLHLYCGLDGTQSAAAVSEVAHELARALEADHPDLVVSDMKKSLRDGKVLVDWSQNNPNKTTIVPYSLRGRARPTVACPRTWRELSSPHLAQVDYKDVLRRIKRRKDPFAALFTPEPAAPEPDRLGTYRQKRSADRTPEPVPEPGTGGHPTSSGSTFVIQRHDATRLHYDFRLERNGVLVSWALPKGVPTETGKNHLAVQTEDHPLDYASFAGVIPQGEYGGGTVEIWDSGTYESEKWRDGKEVIAVLHGQPGGGLAQPRRLALIHTGGEGKAARNWLIHLMKDQPGSRPAGDKAPAADKASAASNPPNEEQRTPPARRKNAAPGNSLTPPEPMLAQPGGSDRLSDDDWNFELKWDGVRILAVVHHTGAALYSRNGIDVTSTYPEVAEALAEASALSGCILDGEVVAVGRGDRPDFSLLQTRMKLTKPAEVRAARKAVTVRYMVFDLLADDGASTADQPLCERRDRLARRIPPEQRGTVVLSPNIPGPLEAALRTSAELGLEGIVAKKVDGRYYPGRRSPSWLKFKHERMQEVVVLGWRPGRGTRTGKPGSLLLGVHGRDGKLHYAGRVGTGFSEAQLKQIATDLGKIPRKTPAAKDVPAADAQDAHWVSPILVGEVQYAEWTASGRLRHPAWRGWRPDKDPASVQPDEPVPAHG